MRPTGRTYGHLWNLPPSLKAARKLWCLEPDGSKGVQDWRRYTRMSSRTLGSSTEKRACEKHYQGARFTGIERSQKRPQEVLKERMPRVVPSDACTGKEDLC